MKILAVYPGRFQPFHKGHAQVYNWLKSKFGNAVIGTSDKVEAPKSPFNFTEKKQMMTLAGVPANSIKQVTNPYIAREILRDYDPKTTVLVFAVSQKDMDEDPRFNFKARKDGKPGYLQPYAGNEKNLKPFGDPQSPKGYVIVTPTFTFDVLGKPATSASELRKQFVSLTDAKQKEFVKDLFGKYDSAVHKLMKTKIGAIEKTKTIKQLREHFVNIGMTYSRDMMPQIGAASSFLKYLKDNEIAAEKRSVDPEDYKSSQMEFDNNKVEAIRNSKSNDPIFVSNDGHILDGHHRWLASKIDGKNVDAYVCDAPILDLVNKARIYSAQLNEELTRKELAPMLDSFVSFASEKLGLKSLPKIRYKNDEDEYNSFAAYSPSNNELSISTMNRHPMDVFRSVAHELVHHKQNEDGRLGKDIAKEGSTGSDIENEANAEAGKIMRWFAKANPDMFGKSYVVEETLTEGINDPGKLKAIFLAGGPGSGKDYVMNSVLTGDGLREINSDTVFEYMLRKNNLSLKMPDSERVEREIVRREAKKKSTKKENIYLDQGLGIIVNGTADDVEKIKTIKQKLEYMGYETMMVFVNTSDEVSKARNFSRGQGGGRKVPDGTDDNGVPNNTQDIRSEKWRDAQKNIGELQKVFGNDRFTVIDNSVDARKATPEEKARVTNNFNRVRRMAQQFVRAENTNPKAREFISKEMERRGITDYQQPRATKTLNQIRQNASQAGHKPDNELMVQARRLGLSYYGFGRFGRKVNGINKVLFHSQGGKLVRVQQMNEEKKMKNDPCWKGYQMVGMKKKNGKEVPNCVPANEAFEAFMKSMGNKPKEREIGTKSLRKTYATMTPGQNDATIAQEIEGSGIGPTINLSPRPALGVGFGSLSESIVGWMQSEKTQQKFYEKYGNLWEDKLIEAAHSLEEAGCGCEHSKKPKSIKKLMEKKLTSAEKKKKEEIVKALKRDGMPKDQAYPIATAKAKQIAEAEQLNERGADSEGLYRSTESGAGLTRKGAKHFGVKTAVTTPPSKLDPKGKAAKRRKSFCARMSGMKGPMKDEKGRPTRKAMSLRRWNCEE